jgi:hypothetical protein
MRTILPSLLNALPYLLPLLDLFAGLCGYKKREVVWRPPSKASLCSRPMLLDWNFHAKRYQLLGLAQWMQTRRAGL